MNNVAVFDLDGTIADITHRLHFIDQQPKDWDGFFAACKDDEPIPGMIAWMAYMRKTHIVVILSGRSDKCRAETLNWLNGNDVTFHHLFMRKEGDHRPDTKVKLDMLVTNVLPLGHINFIVDDRPSVIAMWRERGLKVFAVTGKSWEGRT